MKRIASSFVLAGLLAVALVHPAHADLQERLGALSGDNTKGYLSPLNSALASTMNAGVFQTGFVPQKGFDFSFGVHVMAVQFDDKDKTFSTVADGTYPSVSAPTIVGSPDGVQVSGLGGLSATFPGGLDISQLELAVPEVRIGSVMGTRALVRYFAMNFDDNELKKIDLLGIGLQHSLNRYVHGLPVDVAVGGFYQKFKIGDGLLDTKALHFNVTASRRYGKAVQLEPYVGVGYDKFDMSAKYTDSADASNNISVDFDSKSNMHLTAGASLTLLILRINAEVFSAANTGAALGVTLGR